MYYKKEGFEWERYNTLVELLETTCERYSERIIFSWKKGRKTIEKTYQEWKEDILSVAGKFSQLEAKHIGVISDISYECILSMFAAIVAGKVIVPLEALQSVQVYEKNIEKADIDLVLYKEGTLLGRPETCEMKQFHEVINGEGEGFCEWPKWEENRPACIFFTSGTAGAEKNCVLLSQRNIATATATYDKPADPKKIFYYSPKKNVNPPETVLFLPFYHVLAFTGLVVCINGGYKMFLGKGPKYLSVELLEYRPNFILSVPLICEVLMKEIQKGIKTSGKTEAVEKGIQLTKLLWKFKIDIRPIVFKEIYAGMGGRLRLLTVGGAPMNTEIVDFFEQFGIYLLNGYGMTEASGLISQNTLLKLRSGSAGIILPYNEVKIVDGEIWLRGDNVMLGYYKDEEATKQVMEDGWLKTGDLGYVDRDGYLFITGRKKNLIILSNGVNISPEEIEKELLRSEYIQEIVVCEKNGHLHAEVYSVESMDASELQEKISEEIRKYNLENSVTHHIASWNLKEKPFEKTASLKIKRNRVERS